MFNENVSTKKISLIVVFLFLALGYYRLTIYRPSSDALAQTFDYKRAYQDYLYNYDLYRQSYLPYQTAKSQYLTYRTLDSETKALESTKKMLLARSEALRTYLTALRMRLSEATGILNYQQNLYYQKLDDEISWIENQKILYPSASGLGDLFKISNDFELRYTNSQFFSLQIRGIIFSGRIGPLKEQVKTELSTVEKRVDEMRNAGVNTVALERWLIQARDKYSNAENRFQEAETTLNSMKNDRSKNDIFNLSISKYEQSGQYLKETITILREIIKEIKNA